LAISVSNWLPIGWFKGWRFAAAHFPVRDWTMWTSSSSEAAGSLNAAEPAVGAVLTMGPGVAASCLPAESVVQLVVRMQVIASTVAVTTRRTVFEPAVLRRNAGARPSSFRCT